ncbi:MAG: hypothetical protein N838_29240 [Thiohalocapsa sp. PB-PSB1]|nr:MAG: hypothetical protein N838_29240 [Thiohalocapsa sp. PB-PSB1]
MKQLFFGVKKTTHILLKYQSFLGVWLTAIPMNQH